MAALLNEEDNQILFDNKKEPLCCNFASWQDGYYTCDLFVGDETNPVLTNEALKFSSAYIFKIEGGEEKNKPQMGSNS